jgi:hypothetical protein
MTSHRETVADLRGARRSSGSRGLLGDGGVRTLARRLAIALSASMRGKRIDGTLGSPGKSASSAATMLSGLSCAHEGEGGMEWSLSLSDVGGCSDTTFPVMLSDAASDAISRCNPKS